MSEQDLERGLGQRFEGVLLNNVYWTPMQFWRDLPHYRSFPAHTQIAATAIPLSVSSVSLSKERATGVPRS